jgi:predicted metalloprotease
MKWRGRRQSGNIEDRRYAPRRTRRGPIVIPGVGAGRRGVPTGRLSVGGVVALLAIMGVLWLLGGNPLAVVGTGPSASSGYPTATVDPQDDALAEFVSVVLADTEQVWAELFAAQGRRYSPPTLVLFRGETESGCGFASAQTGPFYCPQDSKIYIDLGFFDQLSGRLGATGDFARAYVIAHEVGHHVQHLLGATDRVHRERGRVSQAEYNELSVRLELQADYYAGVWAHHAERRWGVLEPGDIDEAMRAASAVGDDRLQRQAQGYVVPDSFTHGTSEQRRRWFVRGFESGDLRGGDTFSGGEL